MTMMKFSDVAFGFGGTRFIEGLSFSAGAGELIGLVGPNGAGKSTVLRLAAGLVPPGRGRIELRGRPLASYGSRERAGLLAYLPQNLDVRLPFRVAELVGMGRYTRSTGSGLLPPEALGIVGLGHKSSSPLDELSGGEQRRAFIAMTLVQGAECLLLDEPLSGLDLKYQAELLGLLRQITATAGMTVLMSLHDMVAASRLDRILALRGGLLLADGPPSSCLSPPLVQELFNLAADDASPCCPVGGDLLRRGGVP